MNIRQQIEEHQAKIHELQRQMSNCHHDFKDSIYDPETVREGYGSKLIAHGSDVEYRYEGYHNVQKDRWSRECKICGKKEYTYTREPVIDHYRPKF